MFDSLAAYKISRFLHDGLLEWNDHHLHKKNKKVFWCLVARRKAVPRQEPTRYDSPFWLWMKCVCKSRLSRCSAIWTTSSRLVSGKDRVSSFFREIVLGTCHKRGDDKTGVCALLFVCTARMKRCPCNSCVVSFIIRCSQLYPVSRNTYLVTEFKFEVFFNARYLFCGRFI